MTTEQIKALSDFQTASDGLYESVHKLVELGIIDNLLGQYIMRGHKAAQNQINDYICKQK
jgi:hypothetical protein